MELFNGRHLSSPELRVRNLQMFGRTLVNLARQSGPHTGGKKDVRERWKELMEQKDEVLVSNF